MNASHFFELPVYLLFAIIFCLIILFSWLGYNFKRKQIQQYAEQVEQKVKIVEGTALGTLSLLMGFTFSVAMNKFETQRRIIVQEATYIRTALLRCDMYPDSVRNLLRADFKEYINERIGYYHSRSNKEFLKSIQQAGVYSDRIWNRVMVESRKPENMARTAQLVPALTNMIEIVITRDAERVSHVPPLVLWILLTLILLAAFVLGVDVFERKKFKLPIFGYAIVMTLTLNLIIELTQPARGLINFDAIQQKIVDLSDLLK